MFLQSHYSKASLMLGARVLLSAAIPLTNTLGSSSTGPSTGSSEPGRSRSQADDRISASGYTSARVCGECHSDIYNSWKNSLHAFSLIDPIFDTAFMQAVKEGGEEARRLCLRCHAPMTMFSGDYDLSEGVSREGVSCDFCHTVTAVHLDGREKPYTIDPGSVKRSVIRKAASPAHQVAYSELHSKSEFCGGCHNFTVASGSALLSTYDEWRKGPYAAEGIQCQNCHMVLSAGAVVAREVKESGTQIHLHSLIHDSNQLRGALKVEIAGMNKRAGDLEVDVRVANVGSGHMVPTGIPTREVILTVTAEAGAHTSHQERRYRKVVGDKNGKLLRTDYEILLYGARILNDNRIAPREVRIERFRFPLRGSESAKVKATLSYLYSPAIVGVKRMDIELGTSESQIR